MIYVLKEIGRTFRQGSSEIEALHGIALEIEVGEIVGVTGPSGCGKTTLVNILALLDVEYEGEMSFCDVQMGELRLRERAALRLRKIGLVFQECRLLGSLSALENVAVPHWRLNGSRAAAMSRAEELLEQFGMERRSSHLVPRLSGGEMQRVAIARALVNDPDVLLADEPTGNLDQENTRRIISLFEQIRERGKTIVFVSHDNELLEIATRVISLEYGSIVDQKPALQQEEDR